MPDVHRRNAKLIEILLEDLEALRAEIAEAKSDISWYRRHPDSVERYAWHVDRVTRDA